VSGRQENCANHLTGGVKKAISREGYCWKGRGGKQGVAWGPVLQLMEAAVGAVCRQQFKAS
jgi:hypothetical protein